MQYDAFEGTQQEELHTCIIEITLEKINPKSLALSMNLMFTFLIIGHREIGVVCFKKDFKQIMANIFTKDFVKFAWESIATRHFIISHSIHS